MKGLSFNLLAKAVNSSVPATDKLRLSEILAHKKGALLISLS